MIQCGGAAGIEVIALGEASVKIEMVVNGSVDSNEFLQGSHAPEAGHCGKYEVTVCLSSKNGPRNRLKCRHYS